MIQQKDRKGQERTDWIPLPNKFAKTKQILRKSGQALEHAGGRATGSEGVQETWRHVDVAQSEMVGMAWWW